VRPQCAIDLVHIFSNQRELILYTHDAVEDFGDSLEKERGKWSDEA
jgi:hypothetical protein